MRRLWLSLMATFVLMLFPAVAMAEEVDVLGGFASGLGDFVSPDTVEVGTVGDVRPEQSFDDEYVPVLRETETVVSEDTAAYDGIVYWLTHLNLTVGGNIYTGNGVWLGAVRTMLINSQFAIYMVAAIGIVFLYWGVRKTIRMIFSAFRKGKITS